MTEDVKQLTDSQLSESLFYAGSGTDVRPLVWLADKVRTFVYTDWNTPEDDVRREVEHRLALQTEEALACVSSTVVDQDFFDRACLRSKCTNPRSKKFGKYVVHRNDHCLLVDMLPDGFEMWPVEQWAYCERRQAAFGVQTPWAREFIIRSAWCKEPMRLLYFSDEAVARYCVLYLKRKTAPRFVCTVEAGPGFGFGWCRLEDSDGRFAKFLRACDPRPAVWIRGGSTQYYAGGYWNREAALKLGTPNIHAFEHDPDFPTRYGTLSDTAA